MNVRSKPIRLRELESSRQEIISTLRRELERKGGPNRQWRSRFLASGKITDGKIGR